MFLLPLGCHNDVVHQHSSCYRSYTPWNRGDPPGHWESCLVVHIAHKGFAYWFAARFTAVAVLVQNLVDTYVDHSCSRFDHIASDKPCFANSYKKGVRLPCVLAQVACQVMAHSDSAPFTQQQKTDRFPYNLTVPDNYNLQAWQSQTGLFQQLDRCFGGARSKVSLVVHQLAQRRRVHTLDIFQWVHSLLHLLDIQAWWDRSLHNDACDTWVRIPGSDRGQELTSASVGRQDQLLKVDVALLSDPFLVLDV
mmetsp:Transcript_17527/g.24594  ORF Transcript_17527/g.24594 Transcript_17527/m.24594 type:complete len:251 (+) Transcript_17527:109-861(+)